MSMGRTIGSTLSNINGREVLITFKFDWWRGFEKKITTIIGFGICGLRCFSSMLPSMPKGEIVSNECWCWVIGKIISMINMLHSWPCLSLMSMGITIGSTLSYINGGEVLMTFRFDWWRGFEKKMITIAITYLVFVDLDIFHLCCHQCQRRRLLAMNVDTN